MYAEHIKVAGLVLGTLVTMRQRRMISKYVPLILMEINDYDFYQTLHVGSVCGWLSLERL